MLNVLSVYRFHTLNVFIVINFAICNGIISTQRLFTFYFFVGECFLLLFVVICQSLCHTVPSRICRGRYTLLNPMKYKVE
jgi:hypothetical protein